MNYKELTSKLKDLGCLEIPRRGGGSHRKWYNPANGNSTTIPDWGAKDLKIGTVSKIYKQLAVEKDG